MADSAGYDKSEYQRIFSKVFNKRLKYVLNVNIILSILMTLILDVPFYTRQLLSTGLLLSIVLKVPVYFLALTLIRQVRIKFSTVDYSSQKTLGSQIYHSVGSNKYLQVSSFHMLSALFVYGVFIFNLPFTFDYYLISKEYRKNPLLNDEWVYYWICPIIIGALYSAIQLVFQRNRLGFEYGHNRNSPQNTLFTHVPQALGNSLGLTIIFSIANPIIYWAIRSYLYKSLILLRLFGIDNSLPVRNTSLSTYIKLSLLTYVLVVNWEFENHIFGVYATIGCLDGKKPISSYSKDPLNCLLKGLRDVTPSHELSRLTAFQELAYIATTNDKEGVKLRLAIFSARSKRENLWPSLYEECSLVIREASVQINKRSARDMKALKSWQKSLEKEIDTGFKRKKDQHIFGNSFTQSQAEGGSKAVGNDTHVESGGAVAFVRNKVAAPIVKLVSPYLPQHLLFNHFKSDLWLFKSVEISKIDAAATDVRQHFLESTFGALFRITLKRDCESRVRNPVNFGNAIIAISNIIQRSVVEDSLNVATPVYISNTLNLLEKSIRASTNYRDYLPASVYVGINKPKAHLISELNNLEYHEFYNLCIQFNGLLNDLNLNPKAYELAKWVIDIAIADREQRSLYSNMY
ncbi:NDC1 [Candida margitis]|uniref:NDC1 n=1 Tax=Candida margitis TaxID=1775924 RepID=UPI0022265747|nr:NDC1 [Candida margitis]KAI5968514.1 NDC1 [Candida margitis]